MTHNEAHIGLAEEAEVKSAVLLTNGLGDAKVLPVETPRRIAVIGPERALKVIGAAQPPVTATALRFASDVNLGDRGQGRVNNDPASSYSSLELPCAEVGSDSVLDVSVEVENTGNVAGSEVVMLFVHGPPKPAEVTGERAPKELKGFARVELDANETQRVTIPLRIRDLRHWEGDENGEYVIDPGEYSVLVGPNIAELTLQATFSVKN